MIEIKQVQEFAPLLLVIALTLAPSTNADNALPVQKLTGAEIYQQSCVVCHGLDGEGGMPGIPDLTGQSGLLNKADDVLLNNIAEGMQSPGSVLAMPAKGGNPELDSEDLRRVLQYLRETFQ